MALCCIAETGASPASSVCSVWRGMLGPACQWPTSPLPANHPSCPCQMEVSFSGVPDPQSSDLLAVYSPPDAYAAGAAPVKFANASEAEGYMETGSGVLKLRLVNIRRLGWRSQEGWQSTG